MLHLKYPFAGRHLSRQFVVVVGGGGVVFLPEKNLKTATTNHHNQRLTSGIRTLNKVSERSVTIPVV